MRYRLPIFVIAIFTVLLCASYFDLLSPAGQHSNYKCPPCGCSDDHKSFSGPGHCSTCEMALYKVDDRYESTIDVSTPLLSDNNTALHTKFIYPAFVVAIILGIFSLLRISGRSFNPYLGGVLLVLGLYGFKNQLFGVDYGLSSNFRLLFVPISFILLIGPLCYFYFRSQLEVFNWKNQYFLHFIPAGIGFLIYSALLISDDATKVNFMISSFEPLFGHFEQMVAIFLMLLYLYLAGRKYKLIIEETRGEFRGRWLNRFYSLMLLLGAVWLLLITLNLELFEMGVTTLTYNPLWLTISLIIYWVLIEVMLNPKFFFTSFPYRNSNGYSVDKIEEDKLLVIHTMDVDRLFLDPSLSLDKLAKHIEMNPKYLSLVLNNGFNKNFYEFINEYRIREVKELLISPDLKHLTIAAIANEAGFNSKSSFNSVFKKYTNLTPKEYLRQKSFV